MNGFSLKLPAVFAVAGYGIEGNSDAALSYNQLPICQFYIMKSSGML